MNSPGVGGMCIWHAGNLCSHDMWLIFMITVMSCLPCIVQAMGLLTLLACTDWQFASYPAVAALHVL